MKEKSSSSKTIWHPFVYQHLKVILCIFPLLYRPFKSTLLFGVEKLKKNKGIEIKWPGHSKTFSNLWAGEKNYSRIFKIIHIIES